MWRHCARGAAITIVLAAAATAVVVAGAMVPLAAAGAAGSHHATAANVVTIGGPAPVQRIRAGFLGLSFEYSAIEPYAGANPRAIDPVLLQLVRNLTPGQSPVIRIGGESTDWAWWPVPQVRKPAGVSFTLTAGLLRVTRALAEALRARLILGIDLEADSAVVAGDEARALIAGARPATTSQPSSGTSRAWAEHCPFPSQARRAAPRGGIATSPPFWPPSRDCAW
jgi:hypothetical protein